MKSYPKHHLVEYLDKTTNPWTRLTCATKNNAKPDPEAWSDETVCGHFVMLRIGSSRGFPSCPDCQKIIKEERRASRQAHP